MNEEPNIEELIVKWLDDEISEAELIVLKNHEVFDEFEKIKNATSNLDYGKYDQEKEFKHLQNRLKTSKPERSYEIIKWIAAAVFIGLIMTGLYTTQRFRDEKINTEYASLIYKLPDASTIHLNKNSSISFNEGAWRTKREINLDGEALFSVQKGKYFTVKTDLGNVEVLGTEFNVDARNDKFTVTCFEGKVRVTSNNKEVILNIHDEVIFDNNGNYSLKQNLTSTPTWVNGEFIYNNQALLKVLEDLSVNYNIKINTTKEIEKIKFTGGFDKSNLENALKSIEIPLGLEHKKVNNVIIISKIK